MTQNSRPRPLATRPTNVGDSTGVSFSIRSRRRGDDLVHLSDVLEIVTPSLWNAWNGWETLQKLKALKGPR
jgi:hypothetical protein